ncbi:MAG TPA: LytR C-terminal domain-containing protein [Candidatus Saccharimonadaceae bacterium]|nr:LytR C-terminal domain-containing protein [Candidatus Saccharimonadaceae bacterium]
MAAARKGGASRIGIGLLAGVVAALVLSVVWTYVVPHHAVNESGPAHRVIRVQVLNGSGEGGVASKVASFLREGGFQVVEVRNADRSDYFATLVVARRADLAAARAVSRYLGGPPVIRQAWNLDLADVTVVLGSDRSRVRLN